MKITTLLMAILLSTGTTMAKTSTEVADSQITYANNGGLYPLRVSGYTKQDGNFNNGPLLFQLNFARLLGSLGCSDKIDGFLAGWLGASRNHTDGFAKETNDRIDARVLQSGTCVVETSANLQRQGNYLVAIVHIVNGTNSVLTDPVRQITVKPRSINNISIPLGTFSNQGTIHFGQNLPISRVYSPATPGFGPIAGSPASVSYSMGGSL